ncbi:hypothetical protein CHS0354_011037 [Potamilus streckersoni]|uniref:Uncharacterized protein n=1 Tax=Potamilus streckersoni TaxID=2493646 RepID=A0AAE0TM82_9BIVA|nr:hypothetical protein CHS0354_011037 [Potamilus streckersoni]
MAPRELYSMLLPFLLLVYTPEVNAQTSDDGKNLFKKIFIADAYNKAVRPTFNQTEATNVTVILHLTKIIEFDSQMEILTTSGFLDIYWNDCYLTWNADDYNTMNNIYIPQDSVWKPDIDLQNGVSRSKGFGYSNLSVYVENNGRVNWYPYGIWKSACNIDITYFPFDTQTCDLKFGTWTYLTKDVIITVVNDPIDMKGYETNSEWSIVHTSVYTTENIGKPSVVFKLKLKRKPLFFLLNIMLPVMMLSILNVSIFILPAESEEKGAFSVTVFLALVIFLSIVMATLPHNSEEISFLEVYLVIMAAFSTLAVILTMFQIRLNSRDVDEDPIPSWLIKFQVMVEVIRCKRCNKVHQATYNHDEVVTFSSDHTNRTKDTTSERTNSKPQATNEQPNVTWNQICSSLDFVFFWIFSIATVIITVIIVAIYNTDHHFRSTNSET